MPSTRKRAAYSGVCGDRLRRFGLTRGQFETVLVVLFMVPVVLLAGWARESSTGMTVFMVVGGGMIAAALIYRFVTGREIDDPPPPKG